MPNITNNRPIYMFLQQTILHSESFSLRNKAFIYIKNEDLSIFVVSSLAGVEGFEPPQCLSQSQVPYRLAIPQFLLYRSLLVYNTLF